MRAGLHSHGHLDRPIWFIAFQGEMFKPAQQSQSIKHTHTSKTIAYCNPIRRCSKNASFILCTARLTAQTTHISSTKETTGKGCNQITLAAQHTMATVRNKKQHHCSKSHHENALPERLDVSDGGINTQLRERPRCPAAHRRSHTEHHSASGHTCSGPACSV